MNNTLISIITTVKNGEAFINETLQSIKNQTFKEFEHIIVDDGSTDSTVSIIRKFKEDFPFYDITLFQPGNIGRGKALNLAVSKAKADWIAIIDADDLWHPQKLDIQYKCISENNIDILATSGELFKLGKELKFQNIKNINEIQYFRINDLLKSNRISHSSVLIKKHLCKYDEKRISQFDYELWLRLTSNNKNLAIINLLLNFHRIHDNQSFEGKMGKIYSWMSFKLKSKYALKQRNFYSFFYNFLKLLFDTLLPRKIRLKIRKVFLN